MGKVTTLLVTAVVAVVFGFVGSFAAVSVFTEDLRGPQGATGVPGPPGENGADGADGADGAAGSRGLRGPAGKAARVEAQPYNLGSANCKGRAVSVVTDARVVERRLQLERGLVCLTD